MPVAEIAGQVEITLRPQSSEECVERNSQSEMWDGSEEFGALIFLLDRILLRD